jgi:hypothetical protein
MQAGNRSLGAVWDHRIYPLDTYTFIYVKHYRSCFVVVTYRMNVCVTSKLENGISA